MHFEENLLNEVVSNVRWNLTPHAVLASFSDHAFDTILCPLHPQASNCTSGCGPQPPCADQRDYNYMDTNGESCRDIFSDISPATIEGRGVPNR